MEKLNREDGMSPDLVAENIEWLRERLPEVFTEGRIDFDELRKALGDHVDVQEERYSFSWHGKDRARRIAQSPSMGTLLPYPKESLQWNETKNVFIEGDNLEVLKLLQKSYHRKVRLIYIDPPYNTGSEFIYPDKYQDNLDTYLRYTGQVDTEGFRLSPNSETSGRYHTNWLNMMFPRLKLARNLLRDDGAIFVSIDDHEVHNLRHIMDEVFGSENFVANVVWHKVFASKASAQHFSESHDHILVYARRHQAWRRNLLPRTEEQEAEYKNLDEDPRGPWRSVSLSARNPYSEGLWSTVSPGGRKIDGPPPGRYWAISKESFEQLCADNRIWWGKNGMGTPRRKLFLSEVQSGIVPTTIWGYDVVGSTQDSKKELIHRVKFSKPQDVFETPKPIALVRHMLMIGTDSENEDLILDFFAGSGSTGEAVMAHNMADAGNRRFILVQLPEETPASDYKTVAEIGKARLRAASSEFREQSMSDDEAASPSETDLGFRVFKLAASNIKPWDADFDTMADDLVEAIDNVKPDRTEDDVLYELLLKYGLDLAVPVETRTIEDREVHVIGVGALVVCLAKDVTLEAVSGIAALKEELQPEVMRVVFRDSGFPDDVVKTNASQILRQAGIEDVKTL